MLSYAEAQVPNGLKIFLWSLFWGAGGGALAARLIYFFGMRWAGDDELRSGAVAVGSIPGGLAVGVASAVTAGVTMGRKQQ